MFKYGSIWRSLLEKCLPTTDANRCGAVSLPCRSRSMTTNREDNAHASQDDNDEEEEKEIMTNRWDSGDGWRTERS
eukprot:7835284-Pyramimonas_sp.AAC.1